MILHILLPELSIPHLDKSEKFPDKGSLKSYLDALITSGVAVDEADKIRDVIYVLGQSWYVYHVIKQKVIKILFWS